MEFITENGITLTLRAGEKIESETDMRKQETIGDLQFWKQCIVNYRNKGNAAKSVKKRIDYAKCLCECRHWLKYAEGKLLIVLVLAMFVLSGCVSTIRGLGQGVKGIGQGTGTIVTGVGDFLIDEMEGK